MQGASPDGHWVAYDSNVVLNPQDSSVDFPISDQDDFRLEFFGR